MIKDYNCVTDADRAGTKIKSNFHTHNYLCGHAFGTVCDYAKVAAEHGFLRLGISDHCQPPTGGEPVYMSPRNMDELYLPQFVEARKRYPDLSILAGAEIEYFPGFDGYYVALQAKLDYLVLGQHEFYLDGRRYNSFFEGVGEGVICGYFRSLCDGIKSGYFSLVAHPDLIFYVRPKITRAMVAAFDEAVRTAAECNVAVELNANGIRNHGFRYPGDLLIELCKKYNPPVVVSADAHFAPELVDDDTLTLTAYALKKGLNLVDEIKTFSK